VERSHAKVDQGKAMQAQPRRRRLAIEDIGDVSVVKFLDKRILDEQNVEAIGKQLFGLVEERGRRKLLLNLTNVEYLSSAALGKLIRLNKKLKAADGRLILCNIRPEVYDVLETTKMDHLFDMAQQDTSGPEMGLTAALERLQTSE
jgi:anti-sigma B factor antagonist